jgi:hypothetical protein
MNRASGNVIVFVVVMIVVPWALIWVLRSTGRRPIWRPAPARAGGAGVAAGARVGDLDMAASGSRHRPAGQPAGGGIGPCHGVDRRMDPILNGGSAYP